MGANLILGDCVSVMSTGMDANSVDTIITDPPYELGFMGKKWDGSCVAFNVATWQAALRVAKPGAILLAFGGTRTWHRLAVAIEDAGWEIRDTVMWLYGSGFPKSLDISKAIDKAAGAEREIVGRRTDRAATPKQDIRGGRLMNGLNGGIDCSAITAPATAAAKLWNGWGTALKPAWEPIIVAMKPLDGTFAENAQKYGVAGLNIEGGRIGTEDNLAREQPNFNAPNGAIYNMKTGTGRNGVTSIPSGRFPANLILDEEAGAMLDGQSEGSSRFFYCAKASKSDRGEGNNHPTVKPRKLMEYLCKLTKTPTGGVVLDPFAGSGSTGLGAIDAGRDFIGIEREQEYFNIARRRLGIEDKAAA